MKTKNGIGRQILCNLGFHGGTWMAINAKPVVHVGEVIGYQIDNLRTCPHCGITQPKTLRTVR